MDKLKAVDGRVIVKVDLDAKNSHTFTFGKTIRLERGPNNLNNRETQPVQGEVIDSAYIPEGSVVLFQHNATHAMHEIFNYRALSGNDIASQVKYFSIPEGACYLYHDGDEWLPLKGFVTGLRVFKPYPGLIQGIPHTLLKDTLYVTSGNLKGLVVHTLRASDYQVVFQGLNGQEENIIRCRHWDNPQDDIEGREEIVMIDYEKTRLVNKGKLLVGLTPADAKTEERELNSFVDFRPAMTNLYYDGQMNTYVLDEGGQWPS